MKWHLVTNEQLETIVKHDKDLPSSLLRLAVLEMLDRGMFDGIIGDCVNKAFPNYIETEQKIKMGVEDFMQIGRETVYTSLNTFDHSRGMNYVSFAYMRVASELGKVKMSFRYKKRDGNVISLNNQMEDGLEYGNLFTDNTNVERYVINKLIAEEFLSKVNPHQRKVVLYRFQGYTFSEIAEKLGSGKGPSIFRSYKRAIRNMKEGA